MTSNSEPQTTADCRGAAGTAGLIYTSSDVPGLSRRRTGKGFAYHDPDGTHVTDPRVLRRIGALAIPPAWTSVWICPDENGHVQAVGDDERGRRQYRYHARFREVRDSVKFEHMMAFAEVLPRLRRQVAIDMAGAGLGQRKVLATVVNLLESTMIRVGNADYARENRSYGLTTLLSRHVSIDGADLRFHFKGKSGKTWRLGLHDRRIAKVVKSCQELPGQHLFQYLDDDGQRQTVTSSDVNAYLREVSGADITAKDFRTWIGTVLAANALAEFEAPESDAQVKKNVTLAIERVSARLGNTPTICRKCYVHPEIVGAYLEGALLLKAQRPIKGQRCDHLENLHSNEAAVLSFLHARTGRDNAATQHSTRAARPRRRAPIPSPAPGPPPCR